MNLDLNNPPTTLLLVGSVVVLLGMATGIGQLLKRQADPRFNLAVIDQFNLRIRAWWLMCSVLAVAFMMGPSATVFLFGGLSFWALREFITLTPTRHSDHRPLALVFLFTPVQYVLVGMDKYSLYSIVIPVYAFLTIPILMAIAGDYKRYLERCAKIFSGLMICVYCLSYAPALLLLPVEEPKSLLLFFILVVTVGDALHYAAEQFVGRHVIAPAISANRTWEGFLVSTGCATMFGAALWWATPFEEVWQAAAMSFVITTMGFFGGLTMSAIKRDRGVQDYGTLVTGHGGVLDRIDSICFAAPIFFHLTRAIVNAAEVTAAG